MPLFVLGLNHKTAPIAVRETVAFANDAQADALRSLQAAVAADEAVLVSTCNRTELYLRAADAAAVDHASAWLCARPQAAALDLAPHLYRRSDIDAVRHCFRVASGLDSMVLGEPQILGQVKHAVRVASDGGALAGPLERLFQDTFQVAKRVRTETDIGAASVSLAAAALKLAQQLFGELSETRLLLIGVGEMVELAATHFVARHPRAVVVANRTLERGRELASRFGGTAIALAELPERLHEFDIVITSTASSLPILGKGMVERALKRRKRRPMFMVDLAVPRDIEPEVGTLDDVFLYTLDSLGRVVEQNLATREGAVAAAETIVETEAEAFMRWLAARAGVPVIQQLRIKAESYRQTELERARKRLAKGEDPVRVLEALAHGLTNKFLHHPLSAINRASGQERAFLTDAIERLYPVDGNPEEDA